jgi:hypothetical protein
MTATLLDGRKSMLPSESSNTIFALRPTNINGDQKLRLHCNKLQLTNFALDLLDHPVASNTAFT